MSNLRFLEELGAEFERIGDTHAAPARGPRAHRGLRGAIAGIGFAAAVLVVVVVVAAAVSVRGGGRAASSGPAGIVRVVFRASVPDPRAHFEAAVAYSVEILRERLRSAFHDVHVSGSGSEVVVSVTRAGPNMRARLLVLAVPGSLEFYDWEANALTPSGKPVASLLQTQDPSALAISQGGGAAPGSPGAGSMGLYQACFACRHAGFGAELGQRAEHSSVLDVRRARKRGVPDRGARSGADVAGRPALPALGAH